jgi:hypothetical protein
MKYWHLTSCLFHCLLMGAPFSVFNELKAQTTASGAVAGVVIDQSGALVADAEVEIKDDAKARTERAKTDSEGVYRFSFLAPGSYTLTVKHTGFQEVSRPVNVLLGPPISVNVTLALAKVRTEINVTDEGPLIQAENGDFSTTINQKQISDIPNPGNDLTYVVQTTPGVVMNTDTPLVAGANFSILGMPSISYLYTIDGTDSSPLNGELGPVTGTLGLFLGQNQIQEATVVATGYSGQFGGAAGGNINYITKSGSNRFHGNAQYYWNGRILNANNWFNNAFKLPRPFDIANQWAGSLGGPIQKGRLFFFFDTEGLRILVPQTNEVTIPSPQFEAATIANIDSLFGSASASDSFYRKVFNLYKNASGANSATPGSFAPGDLGCGRFQVLGAGVPCMAHFLSRGGNPSQDALIVGRVDWNTSGNARIFSRLQHASGHTTFFHDPISPAFDDRSRQQWWQAQVLATHALGTSGASQFLFAWSYVDATFGVEDVSESMAEFPTTLNFFSASEQFYSLGNGNHSRRYKTQYQISEDLVKSRGKHQAGFGVNFERIYWRGLSSTANAIGSLSPLSLDAFYQGGVDRLSPDTDFTALSQSFPSQTSSPITFYHLGVYGQDTWRARPDLVFTLALRAEVHSNPVCESRCFARLSGAFNSVNHDANQPYSAAILVNQKQAFQEIDRILWSPRFSFAWQPFGVSHNTVLRGGFGVFYDPVPEGIAYAFSSNPPLVNSFTVFGDNAAPDESTSLFKNAAASNAAFVDGFKAGKTLADIQATLPNFFPPAITIPGNRTHSPQYQRWSLQLQQAIGNTTSLSIGYFGHHGIHELVQNPNANAWGFGSLPKGRCSDPIPDCAPDPRFSGAMQVDTNGVSNYNGLTVSFRRKFSRWSQGYVEANYTYGHALDEVSNGGLFTFANDTRSPFSVVPQDPNNLRGSYGPAEYDVRHSLNANYTWELPLRAALGRHGPDVLVKGWQVAGTVFVRTGLPYTVLDFITPGSLAAKNYFAPLYAVPVAPVGSGPSCGKGAAVPLALRPCQPPQTLADGVTPNPNARFLQVGCETGFDTGNLPGPSGPCSGPAVSFAQGRNRFRGPGYFNTDFALMKTTKLPHWENAVLGIGFQFFNFFNHPNFGYPLTGLAPVMGLINHLEQPPTSILGGGLGGFGGDVAARMIQAKAQLQF